VHRANGEDGTHDEGERRKRGRNWHTPPGRLEHGIDGDSSLVSCCRAVTKDLVTKLARLVATTQPPSLSWLFHAKILFFY